ncbi:hypothetical protein SDC9_92838 [bioreactor metagenome]|uniref:Glucosamine inositolphosphorylceramide transferase 1 N-terminal domain-containing protein n=1 Tax=bioreactor metagenome TaxID=1076179 RepID=A0A644ZYU2_9ZZZZ
MHSWKEMRQRLLGENTDMPLLAVNQYITGKDDTPEPSVTKAPIYKSPGNFGMLQFVCRLWRNRLKFHFRRLFVYENWHVQYGMTFNTPLVPVMPGVTTVSARKGSEFYADPFLFQTPENQYILFEKFSYKGRKGCISAVIPGHDSFEWLVKDTHLAYPFVFNHDGSSWVIPENADAGKCIAYCVDNRLNITRELVLLDLPAVDPTLVYYNKRIYLFCGLKNQLPNEKLFIFWSDTYEGPYKPHQMNPVKVTPVGSRPGGNLKIWQDTYYRPAQVSDIYYGHKILINKIISLSPEVFVEHEFCEINPAVFGSEFCGLHTYTTDGNIYVADLKTHRLGLSAFRFRWKLNSRKGRSDA